MTLIKPIDYYIFYILAVRYLGFFYVKKIFIYNLINVNYPIFVVNSNVKVSAGLKTKKFA